MKKVFISFPYSHEDPKVVAERVEIAWDYAYQLIKEGYAPISPALFGHTMAKELQLKDQDMTFSFWEQFCKTYLLDSDEVHILKLKGWEASTGVGTEIDWSNDGNKRIKYITYAGQ